MGRVKKKECMQETEQEPTKEYEENQVSTLL